MAGNRSMERAKGRLCLGKGEEEGRPLKKPLVCRAHRFERPCRQAQHPVAASVRNPFKLCDFPLVTPARLLY
jgi:hypothetical protein